MVLYESALPIAFPEKNRVATGTNLLAVDIGGTKTDLTLYEVQDQDFVLLKDQVYESQEWKDFADIVRDFVKSTPVAPQRMSIAAAGPVRDGKVKLTNLKWSLDSAALEEALELESVSLINDLEANAYGLAVLSESDLQLVYAGKADQAGNAAIIAPGTGLGEGGLYWDGTLFHPFATEGGHSDFSPRTEQDIALLRYLQAQFGHVSWERLISGPGIYHIYQFLRDVEKKAEPDWLREEMAKNDPAQVIGEQMDKCDLCEATICLFVKYLAIEAANLALKLKATGGLFIGGGIPPKIWNEMLQALFLEHFFQAGRMRPLLETMPVQLILNAKTALLGAAYYGSYRAKQEL